MTQSSTRPLCSLLAVLATPTLLGFAALVGCSSAEDDAPITREEFCASWAEAACSDEVVSACQAMSADACQSTQQTSCESAIPSNFEPAQAADCLDAVAEAYAEADLDATAARTVLRLQGACSRLAVATGQEGASCQNDANCLVSEGLTCVFKGDADEGTCLVPTVAQPGTACSEPSASCTEGFYCDGDNCLAGKAVGGDCAVDRQCASDAFCDTDSGTCAARAEVDVDCTADNQCLSGLCYQLDETSRVCTDRIRLARSEPLCDQLR